MLREFLVFGLITAVGGFFVYIPNILILFLASALIRGSGLSSRVAVLIDPVLRPFGLRGDSCVPLLFGFGCTVNALYDARAIGSRRLQYTTMLVAPFMSCGAKFGVYVLLVSAVFTPALRGTVFMLLYVGGIVVALISAFILQRVTPRDETAPPAGAPAEVLLRRPSLRKATQEALGEGWVFIRKAGTVIVVASLLVWAASSLPRIPLQQYEAVRSEARQAGVAIPSHQTLTLYNSYLARAGRTLKPLFVPLGFDWRATVAVVSGLTGRGVVISTLNAMFGMHGSPNADDALAGALRQSGLFTPLSAWSFMVFVLLSGGCLAAITMFFRHTRSPALTALFVGYPVAVAWLAAFAVYQSGKLLGVV